MMPRNLLVAGNSTMPPSVGIWNLPAIETCTPSPWCRKYCYACQGRFAWKNVREALAWRYRVSDRSDFASLMINEILRRKSIKFVRVHISGDFYNSYYVLQWSSIARQLPGITFRTNTKRQDLISLMKLHFPSNFVVRESIDETRKPTGLYPVAAIKGTPGSEGYFVCCNNCSKCRFYCWKHPEVNVVTGSIL
jgi:ssDNA-binding Zn-finger/Zn-ribbon topoisomerase 1